MLKILIPSAVLLLLLLSCREGVIEPGNFVGKINDPVQINNRNYYSFLLDARSFSADLSASASFSSSSTRISITLVDYEKGSVEISVLDNNSNERFNYFINNSTGYYSKSLSGFIPRIINITTDNFSGKLKIQFTRTQ